MEAVLFAMGKIKPCFMPFMGASVWVVDPFVASIAAQAAIIMASPRQMSFRGLPPGPRGFGGDFGTKGWGCRLGVGIGGGSLNLHSPIGGRRSALGGVLGGVLVGGVRIGEVHWVFGPIGLPPPAGTFGGTLTRMCFGNTGTTACMSAGWIAGAGSCTSGASGLASVSASLGCRPIGCLHLGMQTLMPTTGALLRLADAQCRLRATTLSLRLMTIGYGLRSVDIA